MKVSELTDTALDWAVAVCEKLPLKLDPMGFKRDAPKSQLAGWWVWDGEINMIIGHKRERREQHDGYSPSTNWAQGGPIIKEEHITIGPGDWDLDCTNIVQNYFALSLKDFMNDDTYKGSYGPTPLIAAMRVYVASKLGDEIEIPEELL